MGAACSTYGWTTEQVKWDNGWVTIQKMLCDAPGYEYDDKDSKGKKKPKQDTAEAFKNLDMEEWNRRTEMLNRKNNKPQG